MTNTANTLSAPGRTQTDRPPSYTIYKPTQRGDGAAVSFSINKIKEAVFVEAASQSGERQFDWDNKIIMKWGLSDLGSILAGLQQRPPETKLFHQTDIANSACSLKYRSSSDPDAKPGQAPFILNISRQAADTKEVRKAGVTITEAEAAILETALRTAIGRCLRW